MQRRYVRHWSEKGWKKTRNTPGSFACFFQAFAAQLITEIHSSYLTDSGENKSSRNFETRGEKLLQFLSAWGAKGFGVRRFIAALDEGIDPLADGREKVFCRGSVGGGSGMRIGDGWSDTRAGSRAFPSRAESCFRTPKKPRIRSAGASPTLSSEPRLEIFYSVS